jgi:Chaperone of endosialidase
MICRRILITISILTTAAIAASVAHSETITYQGNLESDGVPVNDTCDFQFTLYDSRYFGAQVGQIVTLLQVSVTDGLFVVPIDFGQDVFAEGERWLRIDVRCPTGIGSYTTLTPRLLITPAPLATALTAPSKTAGEVGGGATVRFENDTSAFGSSGVHGVMMPTTGGIFSASIRGENRSTTINGFGVWASQNGSGRGVYGTSNSGTGVFGRTFSDSPDATGVTGESPRTGVYGRSTAGTGFTSGVFGESSSTSGRGLWGNATSQSGLTFGVLGRSSSTNGRGVYGVSDASSGSTFGVFGLSNSTSGTGVKGQAGGTGVTVGVEGDASSGGWDFFATGAGTDFGSISSRRWKNNIEPIPDPLIKIAKLRGVYYDWDEAHGGTHDLGMIAEEVGEVLPEIVRYEENGIDAIGMDYSKLTPLLVEALNALHDEKDSEINSLRAQNAALLARLERLERVVIQQVSDRE